MKQFFVTLLAVVLMFYAMGHQEEPTLQDMMGSAGSSAYQNRILGVGFRCPGYRFMGQEELLRNWDIDPSRLSLPARDVLDRYSSVRLMSASPSNPYEQAYITLVSVGLNASWLAKLNENELLEYVASVVEPGSPDLNLQDSQLVSYSIDGRRVPCVHFAYQPGGLLGYHSIFHVFLSGDYLVFLEARAPSESSAKYILSHFFWYHDT